jgi:hypothetical protein
MTRQGIRDIQVAFFWGRKTTAEINALIAEGSLVEGDMIFNTDTHHMMVYSQSGSAEPISDNVDSYQFYLKYPYVEEELQKLKIVNSGRIISVSFNQAIGASELTIDACSSITGWSLGTGASSLYLHSNATNSYFKNSTTGTAIGFYKTDTTNTSVSVNKNVSTFSFEDRQIVFETYFPTHVGISSVEFQLVTSTGNSKSYTLTKQMDNSSITTGVNKFFIDYETSDGTIVGNYNASSITNIVFKVNFTNSSITFTNSNNSPGILLSNIQMTYILNAWDRMTSVGNWEQVAGLATSNIRKTPVWEVRNIYTPSSTNLVVDIEPEVLDEFITTSGWTTNQSIGSQVISSAAGLKDNCIKVSCQDVNGWAEIQKTFTSFNSYGKRIRVSFNISSLTGISGAYIRLESSVGNWLKWDISSTELSSGSWTTLTVDPTDNYSDKLGTFNPQAVTKIYLGITTTGTVLPDVYWDSLHLVEGNIPLDEMEVTTGWTASGGDALTLTVAPLGKKDNCLQLVSTASASVETLIEKTFSSFSLLNKYIEFSINPQTLIPISYFVFKIESSSSNSKIWHISKDSIVQESWNTRRIEPTSDSTLAIGSIDLTNVTKVSLGAYITGSSTISFDSLYLNPSSDYYSLPFTKEIGELGGGEKNTVNFITKIGDSITTRGQYTISPLTVGYAPGTILGDFMVGNSSISFDKLNTNIEAGVQNYSLPSVDLTQRIVGNWIKIKEEDLSKISSIDLYLGQTIPGVTWRKFSVTKDYLGKELEAGWNYLEFPTDDPSSVIIAGSGGLSACNRARIHLVTKEATDTLTGVVVSHLNYSKDATGDLSICNINGTTRKIKNKNLLYSWTYLSPKSQEIEMTDLDFTTIQVAAGEYFTISPRFGEYGKNALFEIKVEKD